MDVLRGKNQRRVKAREDVETMTAKLAEDSTAPLLEQRRQINELRKENIRSRLPLILDCLQEGIDAIFQSSVTLIDTALEKIYRRENEAVVSRRSKEGEEELVEAKQLMKDRTSSCTLARHAFQKLALMN